MYAKRGIVLQFRQLLKDSFIIQLHLKDRSIIVINMFPFKPVTIARYKIKLSIYL